MRLQPAAFGAPATQRQPLFLCMSAVHVCHAGKAELAAALQKAASLQTLAQGLSNENKVLHRPQMPQHRQEQNQHA